MCVVHLLPLMFCPECKAEYRPGFTHCSECDVDLVDELSAEKLPSDEELVLLWECAEQSECVGVCSDLPAKLTRFLTREHQKWECSGTIAF